MARIAHIIRNDEITLTECDLMLAGLPATDDLGVHALAADLRVTGDEFAQWDNATTPSDAWICTACSTAYNA